MADKGNEALRHEEAFSYGKGLIPTPRAWTDYFWDRGREKTIRVLEPFVREAETLLFVGVGSGDILPLLDLREKVVYGTEVNQKFLEDASRYCIPMVTDSTSIPLEDESVDLVICNMVLHHIIGQGTLDSMLVECARVLKTGGSLFAFEPNALHPSGMAMNLINRFHLYSKVGGGSDYEYALSPFTMRRVCRKIFGGKPSLRGLTFSNPRFPISLQNAIVRLDDSLEAAYPLSFSFSLRVVKGAGGDRAVR